MSVLPRLFHPILLLGGGLVLLVWQACGGEHRGQLPNYKTFILLCPAPSLFEQFPGNLFNTPEDRWLEAPPCARKADVLLVLGCPARDDGSPSSCQEDRVTLALEFLQAKAAPRVLVSGGAVHTPHIEAEVIKKLLVERGVKESLIWLEREAAHTDENIFYSSKIMDRQGWKTAIVLSETAGHLMLAAACDSNCCVQKGRLTLYSFPLGDNKKRKAAFYALYPYARPVSPKECAHLQNPIKFACTQLAQRKSCLP